MKKRLSVIAASLVLTAVLTACGSNNGGSGSGSSATGNTGVTETGSAAASDQVVVTATNWKFDKPEYVIPQDKDVNISLKTDGIHGMRISNTDVNLKGGESATVNLKAGTYEISCSVPCGSGHSEMKAKLTVQ